MLARFPGAMAAAGTTALGTLSRLLPRPPRLSCRPEHSRPCRRGGGVPAFAGRLHRALEGSSERESLPPDEPEGCGCISEAASNSVLCS